MGAKEAFEVVGLGTPFLFGATTYAFFYWLDRNASTQANRAISAWLRSQEYRRIDMRAAVVGAFDRIYTYPLLNCRAFLRSTVISLVVWIGSGVFIALHSNSSRNEATDLVNAGAVSGPLIASLFTATLLLFGSFILSDYLSLFIVRRGLVSSGNRLFMPLVISFTLGMLIVFSVLFAAHIISAAMTAIYYERYSTVSNDIFSVLCSVLKSFVEQPEHLLTLFPAFLVHFWLLLFAFGAVGVRFLSSVFRLVKRAQWFLKQGDRHPLRAIGMVAAVLVFAGAAIGKALAVIA